MAIGGAYGTTVSQGVLFLGNTTSSVIQAVNLTGSPVTEDGVTIPAGDIATIAGTGVAGHTGDGGPATSAELDSPYGLSISNGYLYEADAGSNTVREIDLTTGLISTVAGDGTPGYSGDGGPATSAEMYFPASVALSNSTLYISDAGNSRIRAVAPLP